MKGQPPIDDNWSHWKGINDNICDIYKLNNFNWSLHIRCYNFHDFKKQYLILLHRFLKSRYQTELELWNRGEINRYFLRRCNNLHVNQSRIIDSISEREKRHITLDRVLLDEQTITDKITSHF